MCSNSKWRLLHQLPAVSREQQVHCVVLQVTFVLQVRADQLSDCCWPVCADKNTTKGLVMSMSHCSVKFQHSTSTATQRKEPKSWCYAKVTEAKQWRASPGNLIISAGLPLCCSAWTSFLHCVVFPALSTPSSTMRAPLLHAIIPRLLLTIGNTNFSLRLNVTHSASFQQHLPAFFTGSRTTHFLFRLLLFFFHQLYSNDSRHENYGKIHRIN